MRDNIYYFLILLGFSLISTVFYIQRDSHFFKEFWPKPLNLKEESHLLENSCKFAFAETIEPSLEPHITHNRNVSCEQESGNILQRNKDGSFSWTEGSRSSIEDFNCTVMELGGGIRPDALSVTITRLQEISQELPSFTVNADNFVINCSSGNETIFSRQYMGLKDFTTDKIIVEGRTQSPRPAIFNFSQLSISILGLDSVARSQFARHMIKTSNIMKEMGFITLNGYNKVGDNSAVNLLPIIADRMELAKRHPLLDAEGEPNKNSILPGDIRLNPNHINFIWKRMNDSVTLFNDDIMHLSRGLFHYPVETWERGFEEPPTTHFYRPFYVHLYRELNKWKLCHDGRILPEEYFDTWKRFLEFYSNRKTFSFNFIASITHDNPSDLEFLDDPIAERLESLNDSGVLENTVLIIMGDHGNRVWPTRSLLGGKIEERQPLMSIYLPPAFRNMFPEVTHIFKNNANRITNNFDIYETLLDIIEGKLGQRSGERGVSLFKPITLDRNCIENNVPIEYCLCMEKVKEDFSHLSTKLQNALIEYLKDNPCLELPTLGCNSEIEPYLPNQVVLAGMRSRSNNWKEEINKKLRIPDSIYLYTTCKVRNNLYEPLQLKVQFRYLRESQIISIIIDPLLISHSKCASRKFVSSYCKCVNNKTLGKLFKFKTARIPIDDEKRLSHEGGCPM